MTSIWRRRSFFSFFFLFCFWLCAYFLHQFWIFPICPISHFFPFSSSLNLFANNKRDKKMVRVSFSLTFPPSSSRCFGWYGFVYVRIRLREAFARVASLAKAEGSARIFLGRSIWREKLLSCVCVFEQMCGPCRCQYQARAHGAKVQSIHGRDFRIIHEFVRVNCNHRGLWCLRLERPWRTLRARSARKMVLNITQGFPKTQNFSTRGEEY